MRGLEHAGHRVSLIDAVSAAPTTHTRYFRGYLVGLPFEEIAARVPSDTKVVGITALFTHEWPSIVKLVEAIKAVLGEAIDVWQIAGGTLVLGGVGLTMGSRIAARR